MSSKVTRIVFHTAAFRSILRSGVMAADLTRRGERIAAAAGEGFGSQTNVGRHRVRVTVAAETRAAARAEATDKVLTRAIGAGRG
jgi:aspartate/methionine/tyrosine aminotransferase